MATTAAIDARLRRLETHVTTHRPWLRPVGLPRQTVDQQRATLAQLIELGAFLPIAHASTVAAEAQRRRMAQALWPDEYDQWLAEAEASAPQDAPQALDA